MKTKKQRRREEELARKPEPRRAAHVITEGRERMDVSCDSCAERFELDAQELRDNGELELTCPYCNRKMLVQHVEYAVARVIE